VYKYNIQQIRDKILGMLSFFIIFIIILFIWGFVIEPNLLVVKHYKLENNNLKGKRIVFVSDFNISKHDKHRLRRIVKLINKQNADLVLSGGDYIKGHSGKHSLAMEIIASELAKIKAPFITAIGNHDGKYNKLKVINILKKNGLKVLVNSNTKIEDIYISAVDDMQTGNPYIEKALFNTTSPRILISHTPDIYFDVKEEVDLILAGHVHGGQVRLPWGKALILPSKFGTKFTCGYFKETKNPMIVTKGLGTSILNVRFCTIPEIVVIEFI